MLLTRHHAFTRPIILGLTIVLLPACQLVKVKENNIHQPIRSKSENILTHDQLSAETTSLLKLLSVTPQQCSAEFETCLKRINTQTDIAADERYATLSELYLAQAFEFSKQRNCTQAQPHSKNNGGVSKSMLKKSRLNFDKIEKCK